MDKRFSEFEDTIGYEFKDKELLHKALSHSSYANENGFGSLGSNERLEFLGDAVLELAVSEELFYRYPDMNEGELTKLRAALVCEPSLAQFSKKINLSGFILLGLGEEKTGGRTRNSIISDCMEAVIGAIFLDSGMDAAKEFINRFILYDIENVSFFSDSKTKLQEITQAEGQCPVYTLISEEGPAHAKIFTMQVSIGDKVLGCGSAGTKKKAEQEAARQALLGIEEKDQDVS